MRVPGHQSKFPLLASLALVMVQKMESSRSCDVDGSFLEVTSKSNAMEDQKEARIRRNLPFFFCTSVRLILEFRMFLQEKLVWMSVPAFGEWDRHREGTVPDYSVDFSKIRENRRRNKSHVSIGADEDLFSSSSSSNPKEEDAGRVESRDPIPEINRPILQSRSPTVSSSSLLFPF